MGTFLTTPRMSPALAARVEAAVSGRRGASRRGTVFLRFAAFVGVLGVGVVFAMKRPSCANDVDQERAVFVRELEQANADVSDTERALPARVAAWLGAHTGAYEGDFISPTLRDPALVASTLARPIVYVRGTLDALASSDGLAAAAEESFRDAFVYCLYDPPEKRAERDILKRVRAAHAGSNPPAVNVERLLFALRSAAVLDPTFRTKIDAADSQRAIGTLRTIVRKAELDVGKRALRSELLLAVLDEPKEGDRPSELDGAFTHHARVVLVDLATGDVLLRRRELLDPAWIAEGPRVEFATGINACELGMAVRAALPKSVPSAASSVASGAPTVGSGAPTVGSGASSAGSARAPTR